MLKNTNKAKKIGEKINLKTNSLIENIKLFQ